MTYVFSWYHSFINVLVREIINVLVREAKSVIREAKSEGQRPDPNSFLRIAASDAVAATVNPKVLKHF